MVATSSNVSQKTAAQPGRNRWWIGYFGVVKQAAADWVEDNAMRLAASLAFYTMLSLAPLLVLAIKAVGLIFGDSAARGQVRNYIDQLMGTQAADAVSGMLTYKLAGGVLATTVSIIILLVSASSVFGELQDALNTVWEVKPKPGRAFLTIIRERFFSFALVLGTCFLLLVSLIVSAVLSGLIHRFHSATEGVWWQIFYFVISMAVITVMFAMIFKYLPDVKIRWRDVWVGAVVTGLLFTVGKLLLGWYLGRASATSVYGAAGSLVAMLLWVYYSAQILFFGAEITQAYARAVHERITPTENAVKVTEEDRAQQGLADPDRVQAISDAADRGQTPPHVGSPPVQSANS